MEASLQSHAVKNFKRILTCMSRFGEDLCMQATDDGLQISTVNSSKSAFCLFTFGVDFFQRYALKESAMDEDRPVRCKLLVKSVLSVLGRGTLPQDVDRLDLKIVDAGEALRGGGRSAGHRVAAGGKGKGRAAKRNVQGTAEDDEDDGGREAKLVIKLVCKHGVLKTHSLNLSPCTFLIAVVDPNSTLSRFVVPAKTLKDWIDHFALSGSTTSVPANATNPSNKYESELGWYFGEQEVRVKTWEGGGGATKKGISTEIKVDVNEFEEYYVEDPPVTLTFPMREFRAAFALAESLSLPLTTSFSYASQPLSIHMELEAVQAEFAIATTRNEAFDDVIKSAATVAKQQPVDQHVTNGTSSGIKRKMDQGGPVGGASNHQPSVRSASVVSKKRGSLHFSQSQTHSSVHQREETSAGPSRREPLFRPPSQAPISEAIRASGLGIENMDEEELLGMMQMDEGELDDDYQPEMRPQPEQENWRSADVEREVPESPTRDDDEETLLPEEDPSQALPSTAYPSGDARRFEPLFDD